MDEEELLQALQASPAPKVAPSVRSGFADREPRKQAGLVKSGGFGTALKNVGRSVAQGATFGFADEIEAGVRTGFGQLGDYQGTVADVRNQNDQFREEHPVMAFGSEVAGSILMPGGAAKVAGKFAPSAVRGLAGLGARTGAKTAAAVAEGALSGLGASEDGGGFGEAVMGGLVGGGASSALRGLTALPSMVGHAARAARDPNAAAASTLRRVLTDGTPVPANNTLLSGTGAPSTILDAAGTAAKRVVRGAKTRGGAIGDELGDALGARREGAAERVVQQVKKGLGGDEVDVTAAKEELVAKLRKANDVGYDAVRARGATIEGPELAAVLGAEPVQKAWGRVAKINSTLRAAGEEATELPSLDDVIKGGKLDIGTADELKRGLDDILRNGYDGSTMGGLKGAEKASIVKLKDKLVSLAEQADDKVRTDGPSYREVRAAAEKGYKGVDALAEGDGFLTLGPKEFATKWKAMDPDQQSLYLLGARSKLIERLGNSDQARDRTRGLLGSPNFKAKVRTMLGKDADGFLQGLDAERTLADTDRFVMGGSATADKMADAAPDIGSWGEAIRSLRNPGAAAGFAINKGLGAMDRISQRTTNAGGDIAAQQLLRSGDELDDVLAFIAKNAKSGKLDAYDSVREMIPNRGIGGALARRNQQRQDRN